MKIKAHPKTILKKGNARPSAAILACMHGDEIIGMKVCKELIRCDLMSGSLTGFLAHPSAHAHKKREFSYDLNRIFPVKGKTREHQLARNIFRALREFDLVIDIHGTNSRIDSLAIVTKWNARTKRLLAEFPVKKVMYVPAHIYAKGALISHVPLGISIEYGPNKLGHQYRKALAHVEQLLINRGMLRGTKQLFPRKTLYTVIGKYDVPEPFRQNPHLRDFERIERGAHIGSHQGIKLYATRSFYPIFLGKGRYKGALALMTEKRQARVA
ncbi:MAG: succinylglutamate desuccinylase/aspartoacylase family protein [Patescibacteria group bacterium]